MGKGGAGSGELLLVEDNEADILFLKRALSRVGCDAPLRIATNGLAAVEALSGNSPLPTLVLLDLKLPRLSGLEVLSWMKTQPRLEPVRTVVLTSSQEPRDIRRAYELGIVSYVVKPVEIGRLKDVAAAIGAYLADPAEPARAALTRLGVAVSAPA